MPITENQKRIYNLHLSSYKKQQNKPYTLRENFENFEKSNPEDYVALLKLELFFQNHVGVNPKTYFKAPYIIYEDKDYFNLAFYNSQAAVKCYNLYLKQLLATEPDSIDQVNYIKESLSFVKKYCIEKKILLADYLKFKDGLTFAWATHIATNQISYYLIIGFDYFHFPVEDNIYEMPEDEREMLVSDFFENYKIYKSKLDNSKFAKKLIIEGIKILDKNVNEHLKSIKECDKIVVNNK